jgi:hypothetical protein
MKKINSMLFVWGDLVKDKKWYLMILKLGKKWI